MNSLLLDLKYDLRMFGQPRVTHRAYSAFLVPTLPTCSLASGRNCSRLPDSTLHLIDRITALEQRRRHTQLRVVDRGLAGPVVLHDGETLIDVDRRDERLRLAERRERIRRDMRRGIVRLRPGGAWESPQQRLGDLRELAFNVFERAGALVLLHHADVEPITALRIVRARHPHQS